MARGGGKWWRGVAEQGVLRGAGDASDVWPDQTCSITAPAQQHAITSAVYTALFFFQK